MSTSVLRQNKAIGHEIYFLTSHLTCLFFQYLQVCHVSVHTLFVEVESRKVFFSLKHQ